MNRPRSTDRLSPNFTPRDKGREITCVILHSTASSDRDGAISWLCNPESKVSAHYVIDHFGGIFRLVDESNVAWHAGHSLFKDRAGVNNFSVGIELVNLNDGKEPYPEAQIVSCADLVTAICLDHSISAACVV